MSRGHFIGLNHHRIMLSDAVRMAAYQSAIAAAVRPGDVVVDLGTGTGVLAMWAAAAGARIVYAIDPAPVIRLARRLASRNAGGDRIVFIESDARSVTLPEPADVLVTECMGNFFVTDELAPVLRDARRLVKEDARVLPSRFRLRVAPVFMPVNDDITFWDDPIHGLDLSLGREFALQSTYVRHVDPRLLVASSEVFADFSLFESPDTLRGRLTFTLPAGATVHGLVGWFEADLGSGIVLDTGPGVRSHWAQLVFPLDGLRVPAGGRIEASLELAMSDEYASRWRWWGRVLDAGGAVVAEFDHDTDRRF